MAMEHISDWARSRGQRPIQLYHSPRLQWSSNDRPLVLMGGVHGDEPEGVQLAEDTLSWLRQNSDQVSLPWILIPCLNPDGFAVQSRTNDAGVDLNRNYPAQSWSPIVKEPRYNPGPHAGSEPEVQAVVKLIEQVKPRLIIHCHSWHPCIVMTGEPARKDAERLAQSSGYNLQETIGYDTPGSLSQFGWFDRKIPIICIEEQEGTPLPQVWGHFENGIRDIFLDNSLRVTK